LPEVSLNSRDALEIPPLPLTAWIYKELPSKETKFNPVSMPKAPLFVTPSVPPFVTIVPLFQELLGFVRVIIPGPSIVSVVVFVAFCEMCPPSTLSVPESAINIVMSSVANGRVDGDAILPTSPANWMLPPETMSTKFDAFPKLASLITITVGVVVDSTSSNAPINVLIPENSTGPDPEAVVIDSDPLMTPDKVRVPVEP